MKSVVRRPDRLEATMHGAARQVTVTAASCRMRARLPSVQ
jgi:hypothetical protein